MRTVRRLAVALTIVAITALPVIGAASLLLPLGRWASLPGDLAGRAIERLSRAASEPAQPADAAPAADRHAMDGRLRPGHPRILTAAPADRPGDGTPSVFAQRARALQAGRIPGVPSDPCPGERLLELAACYATTGDRATGAHGLEALERFAVIPPRPPEAQGNAWRLALAYDLLARHPAMTPERAAAAEERLESALADQLAAFMETDTALWHGRSTLAANAWLTAAVLTPHTPGRRRMIAHAQTYFLDSVEALRLTEAWPEGYHRWVEYRALPLVLGAVAYLNGVEGGDNAEAIRRLLVRVGLWHVYATRPDGRAQSLGDEGPRLDLRHDTRPVVDLLAQATRDPVLAGYSRYLGRLHGAESYAPDLAWAFRLFNDPLVEPWPGTEDGDLRSLAYVLPQAEVFGRGAMNQAYIRTGWGPDDTFVSVRAGDVFSPRGHYDAGHFTLYHGAPLAVDSSPFGDLLAPNRLHYAIRTVAKNSLLVLRPGERVRPTPDFSANIADGGQRVVLPTGSALRDTEDWRRSLTEGPRLAAGELLRFDRQADDYAYLLADLTSAYNTPGRDEGGIGGKVRSVRRELLYLFEENVLLVNDEVATVDPLFRVKWLLHTLDRPQAEGLRVLRGRADDGILETDAALADIEAQGSFLRVHRLLPADGVVRLVGGPNHRYYVEYDGDDRILDGVNVAAGTGDPAAEAEAAAGPPRADWRIEIQSRVQQARTRFLVALVPSRGRPSTLAVSPIPVANGLAHGVQAGDAAVVFVEAPGGGPVTLRLPGRAERLYVVGLPPNADLRLTSASGGMEMVANRAGLAYSPLGGLTGRLTLAW
jgi:hypothetical protein